MAGPFIFIATNKVRDGKLEDEKNRVPVIATQLRDRKLAALAVAQPEPRAIVSANIGCISHLQSGTATPARHWIELVDERLAG